jgi:hypothetical protein
MQLFRQHLIHLAIVIAFMVEGIVCAQLEPIFIPSKFNMSRRVTKSSPGWLIRLHQANETLEDTFAERENVLAGTRPDSLGFPLENFAMDTSATITDWIHGHTFALDVPVNLNAGNIAIGVSDNESAIPGIPGFEGSTQYITSEIRLVLEVPRAGLYRFGLHASGGLHVVTGNVYDSFDAVELVSFEGDRAAETVRFDLEFERNGLYEFRVLWFNAEENPSLEWWTLNEEDTPILLNSENGLKTYPDIPEPLTSITKVTPEHGATGVLLDQDVVTLQLHLDDAGIATESIQATLQGEPAPHEVSAADTEMTIKISLPELSPFTEYDWTLSFETGNELREIAGRFTTTVFGAPGALFIEAEDFDFNHGNWDQVNPIGMTGPYPGGAYRNRGNGHGISEPDGISDLGIDYLADPSSNDDPFNGYRAGTGVSTVSLNRRSEDIYRGDFNVLTNHAVTNQQEGEWLNFTRLFPMADDGAKTFYHVFVRIASADAPLGLALDQVISGQNTVEQETEKVAELISETGTDSQDSFEISPLFAVSKEGSEVEPGTLAVVELGGEETLRITSLEGTRQNIDYLLLIPATQSPNTKEPGAILGVSRTNDQLTIEFTGTLLSADSVNGDYQPVENATSPFTFTPDQSQAFFVAE